MLPFELLVVYAVLIGSLLGALVMRLMSLALPLLRSLTDELQMSNPQLGQRWYRWVWVSLGQFWGRNLRRILDLGFVVVSYELVTFDQAVTQASCCRKRAAESWDDWWEANRELRRSKRRRTAWLRDKEVAWWDAKAQKVQDQADQGDAFGVFATFQGVTTSRLLCCFG